MTSSLVLKLNSFWNPSGKWICVLWTKQEIITFPQLPRLSFRKEALKIKFVLACTIQSKYGRRNNKTFMKSKLKQKIFLHTELSKWSIYWSIYFFQKIEQSHFAKGQIISKVNYNVLNSHKKMNKKKHTTLTIL